MTPFYDLNQHFSPMPLLERDHDPSHLHPFPLTTDQASSVPCPIFFNSQQEQAQEPNNTDHNLQQQVVLQKQEFVDQQLMIHGSSNFPISFQTNNTNNILVEESLCDQHSREEDQKKKSFKWMSSKMRIMRKMMSPDGTVTKKPRRSKQLLQDQQPQQSTQSKNNNNNNNNTNNSPSDGGVRVCSDCNTTKTPLWRSGPSGPKSLCNACGIRQRRARRAVAAAAAVSSGLIPAAAVATNKVRKHMDSDIDRTVPFKKRCRFYAAGGAAQKKLCFDDIVIRLSKSSAFHRVFPQDEKDAAILLMALSCGLMCS